MTIWGNTKKPYYELTSSELAEISLLRKEAHQTAQLCSGKSAEIPFEKIDWVLIPGSTITVNAVDGKVKLKGYYSPSDTVIYMPFTERATSWIMVHESLHSLGYIGHPDIPFKYPCRAMADQNP